MVLRLERGTGDKLVTKTVRVDRNADPPDSLFTVWRPRHEGLSGRTVKGKGPSEFITVVGLSSQAEALGFRLVSIEEDQ